MSKTLKYFIDGKHVEGRSGRFFDVTNPATGYIVGSVPLANSEEVNFAVESAARAFLSWSSVTPLRRARILCRYKALLEAHSEELVSLISLEHGKLLDDARGSLTRGMEVIEFACGIPHLLKGSYSEGVGTGINSWDMRQPLGVCTGIVPFNFPAMVPLWMFPLAVACGNTFVLKASPEVPSCAFRFAELASEAGFPPGVFNVISGDQEAGEALMEHPLVKAVSFVGSTPVGRHVYKQCAENGKRVQALTGAKNHMVILPDADMDQVVNALMGAGYGSAGERCMAISVAVTTEDSVADKLVERLSEAVRLLKVGPFTDKDAEMGPLVSRAHLDRVVTWVNRGVEEGASLVVDGRSFRPPAGHEEGYFLGGCLFDHVKPHMDIYQEEIFGPVLCIVRADGFEEALRLVNAHRYGNGAAVFTRDGEIAHVFASRVEAGMVGVNVPIPVPVAYHSFGGWKESLFGDMHIHGMEGVRFYTRQKTVTQRWPGSIGKEAEFAMPTLK